MARDDENDGAKFAMGCGLVILMIPLGILLKGFVLCQMWAWFMVPLGVVSIGQAHAYGLATMTALFVAHSSSSNDDDKSVGYMVLKSLTSLILLPLLVWFVGWICHMYM